MKPIIYAIRNPLGQCYVGSTVNFANRRKNHRRDLRKGRGVNKLLQASWDAHGAHKHTFLAVASVLDPTEMHLAERDVMRSLGSELNVNLDPSPVFLNQKNIPRRPKNKPRQSPLLVPYGPHISVRGFARDLGLTHKAAKYYQKTYSYEAAIYKLAYTPPEVFPVMDHPLDPRKQMGLINLAGKWVSSVALRAENGVTDRAYLKRRASGWTRGQALTLPLGTKRPLPKPVSRKSICTKYGILDITYKDRRVRGWTLLQALGAAPPPTPPKRKSVKKRYLTADGKTKCLDDWAVLTGLSKNCISARLTAGHTPEQALGLEKTARQIASEANLVRVKAKPKRPTFTVKGFTGTIMEIAAHFLVADSVIRGRQRMGWPEDDWVKPKAGFRDEYVELLGEFMDEV